MARPCPAQAQLLAPTPNGTSVGRLVHRVAIVAGTDDFGARGTTCRARRTTAGLELVGPDVSPADEAHFCGVRLSRDLSSVDGLEWGHSPEPRNLK